MIWSALVLTLWATPFFTTPEHTERIEQSPSSQLMPGTGMTASLQPRALRDYIFRPSPLAGLSTEILRCPDDHYWAGDDCESGHPRIWRRYCLPVGDLDRGLQDLDLEVAALHNEAHQQQNENQAQEIQPAEEQQPAIEHANAQQQQPPDNRPRDGRGFLIDALGTRIPYMRFKCPRFSTCVSDFFVPHPQLPNRPVTRIECVNRWHWIRDGISLMRDGFIDHGLRWILRGRRREERPIAKQNILFPYMPGPGSP